MGMRSCFVEGWHVTGDVGGKGCHYAIGEYVLNARVWEGQSDKSDIRRRLIGVTPRG